jgi:glycogen operon protein
VFRRQQFFRGYEDGTVDLDWLRPDGDYMTQEDWAADRRSLMFFLNGQAIPTPDARGQQIRDDSFLVLINGKDEGVKFTMPGERYGKEWQLVIDTAEPRRREGAVRSYASDRVDVVARSIQIHRRLDDAREH